MHALRAHGAVALTALLILSSVGAAGSLAASPSPAPASSGPSPSVALPGSVDWQPVSGVLGNALPGFSVDTTAPIVWKGHFYTIELDTVATVPVPNKDQNEFVVWRQPATWRSSDGQHWQRRALPSSMTGHLSMIGWGDRLVIIDQREGSQERGWWFLVWSSTDGTHWRRQGGMRQTPTGDLAGCGLNDGVVVTAGIRLVAIASCRLQVGAGGDITPGYQTIGSAAIAPTGETPTYSWTSVDGRHWSRHTSHVWRNPYTDGLSVIRSVGRGVAAVACCRDPRLLWSVDGAHFQTIASLPDVHLDAGSDIAASTDDAGTPVTWLLAARGKAATAVALGMDRHGWALWVLDPGQVWRAAALIGDTDWTSIATDGDLAIATATRFADEGTLPTLTLTSTDAARTWASSQDPSAIEYCENKLAMRVRIVTMGCDGGNGSGLWRAEMPTTPVP